MAINDGFAIIGCLPNFTGLSTCTLTCGQTPPAEMPLTNLQTPEPSEKCRLESLDPMTSYIEATFSHAQDAIGFVGLAAVNAGIEGRVRVVLSYGGGAGPVGPWVRTAPNGVADVGGVGAEPWSGAVGNVDEDPASLDGLTNGPGGAAVAYPFAAGQYAFATPSSAATGTDRAFIGVRWKKTGTAAGHTVTCALHESATNNAAAPEVLAFDSRLVTADDQWMFFFFDPSLFASTDLSNLLFRVSLAYDRDSSNYVDLDAVALYTTSGNSGASSPGYPVSHKTESGVFRLATLADVNYWSGHDAAYVQQLLDTHFGAEIADALSSVKVTLYIVDDKSRSHVSYKTWPTYHDIGCLGIGPSFKPARCNFERGSIVRVRDPSKLERTDGGQKYGARRRPWREFQLNFPLLSDAEAWSLFDRLDGLAGLTTPFWVALYPDDETASRHTTCYVTLASEPDFLKERAGTGHKAKGYSLEEKL